MNFDATTFLFEIGNFLVLVWLLHRFLYRPVLGVLDRRKAGIEQQLNEAHTLHEEAAGLEREYQRRLADWEREREAARADLQADLQSERERLMARLNDDLERELERNRSLQRQRDQERAEQAEQEALALALSFVTRLLERLAGPELEARLVSLGLADLSALNAHQRRSIAEAIGNHNGAVRVATAYPVAPELRREIAGVLSELAGREVACDFVERHDLLAGLRIDAGHWVLSANLLEELKFFQEAGHDS